MSLLRLFLNKNQLLRISAEDYCRHEFFRESLTTAQRSCVLAAGSAIGCSSTDYACQCSKSSALGQNALGCVLGACGIPTALAVRASASAVCACVATATNGGRADMAGRAAVTAVPGRMERAPRPIATANV